MKMPEARVSLIVYVKFQKQKTNQYVVIGLYTLNGMNCVFSPFLAFLQRNYCRRIYLSKTIVGNAIKLNSAEHTNPWLCVHKPHIEQCHHLLTEAHSAGFKFKLHCSSVLLINIQSTHLFFFSTEKGLQMALQELKNSYLIEMKTQGFGPDNWMKLCCTSSFSGLTSFYDNDN